MESIIIHIYINDSNITTLEFRSNVVTYIRNTSIYNSNTQNAVFAGNSTTYLTDSYIDSKYYTTAPVFHVYGTARIIFDDAILNGISLIGQSGSSGYNIIKGNVNITSEAILSFYNTTLVERFFPV